MDHRGPLKLHTVLPFPGMPCHIERIVGCGSNAICYQGWYPDQLEPNQRHHVLIKELFPYHPQGKISRGEGNRILVENGAEDFFYMHQESFEEGNRVHLRLLEDYPESLGANLNSFSFNGTLYSVLGYSGGRSLQEALATEKGSLRRYAQWMLRLLDALEVFHKSGYLHLDISPDNIMLVGKGDTERIFLIDYNSARPVGAEDSVYISFKAGYSAPEVETNSTASISYSSDLYSVAAVFFRCIMGRALTLEESLRAKAPDGAGSPFLEDVPQTVSSMIARILKKGLHTLPNKRYRSIGQLRQAFEELLDRIDCVGVTHWSLWENGRRSIEQLIRKNPALRYLEEENGLYPIRLGRENSQPLQDYLTQLLSARSGSGLILAGGGMGKTTLLLHTAMLQGKRYSPSAPAVFYISLNGWNTSDPQYIRRQILMRLRFKREENCFESAMHALHQLLQQPIMTKTGEVPSVLLLLDGLNEIQGDLDPLVQEINLLAGMAGVRILAASRSEMPALKLAPVELVPLITEDIEAVLGRRGLLIPRNQTVLQLLRTPLILSLYTKAGNAGKQLDIHSEEELLNAYMEALLKKELAELPENDSRRWQLACALHYILPVMAAQIQRSGSLTDAQLLRTLENCWNVIHSRVLGKVFPQWIGHSQDILAGCETPEQWYGRIVHEILWQKLGLLIKDEQGRYLVFHQKISEFLACEGKRILHHTRSRQILRGSAMLLAAVCTAALLVAMFMPQNYDERKTEQVIDSVVTCYSSYGYRLVELQTLTDLLQSRQIEDFLQRYERYTSGVAQAAIFTQREQGFLTEIDTLCASADRVAWSKEVFDGETAKRLVQESSVRLDVYLDYLPQLKLWAQSQRVQETCPDYPLVFSRLLEMDARYMSKLYYQSCEVHMQDAKAAWAEAVDALLKTIPETGKEPPEKLSYYQQERDQLLQEVHKQSARIRLIGKEEGLLEGE